MGLWWRLTAAVGLAALAMPIGAVVGAPAARAAEAQPATVTVTSCTEAALLTALGTGGPIVFACDGVISLSHQLVIGTGMSVSLDGNGHSVSLSGGNNFRIFRVDGGSLTLRGLNLTGGLDQGAAGTPGAAGGVGSDGTAGVNGGPGTAASPGGAGANASGGAMYIASGAAVYIEDSLFNGNEASGGAGGSGGGGGKGGNGGAGASGSSGGSGGGGGNGGNGASGASGGLGRGGAIYNAGTLTLIGDSFVNNTALGGNGGNGGAAGAGGSGGSGGNSADHDGGSGGAGGAGGNAGASAVGGRALGGAIYNSGSLSIAGGSFQGSHATSGSGGAGGNGGNGGDGGDGGNALGAGNGGTPAAGGHGGNADNAGPAGNAYGGAIYNVGTLQMSCLDFSNDTATARGGGYGGSGGAGGNGGDGGDGGPADIWWGASGGTGGNGGNEANGGNGGSVSGGAVYSSTAVRVDQLVTYGSGGAANEVVNDGHGTDADEPGHGGFGGAGGCGGDGCGFGGGDGYEGGWGTAGADGTTTNPNLSGTTAAGLGITTASIPHPVPAVAYSATLAASNGTGSLVWRVVSDHMPAGLQLDAATGVLSGTSTDVAVPTIAVLVTDTGSGQNAYRTFDTRFVPSAPLHVAGTPGTGSAVVSWDPPASPGSSAVTGYQVTSTPGSKTCAPVPATAGTCTVTGLTNGTTYTFAVTATSAVGTSPASVASGPVIPTGLATHLSVVTTTTWTAGASHSVSVKALDSYGHVDASYIGTVHITSSDSKAVLPAYLTFTPSNQGVFVLIVKLETAGTQSITVTDTGVGSITGTKSGIVVSPATATRLTVASPASWNAGATHSTVVKALDAYGNVATGYQGTIHFTSSDSRAVLPADYTFTSGDAGVHTSTITLKTAGIVWIVATDTGSASIKGSKTGIVVNPGAATHLSVTTVTSWTAGSHHSVTVNALDAYGNVATGYLGTVGLTSSDSQAVLPANHAFTSSDKGVYAFVVTLKTRGTQSITATDSVHSSITGRQSGIVVQ